MSAASEELCGGGRRRMAGGEAMDGREGRTEQD